MAEGGGHQFQLYAIVLKNFDTENGMTEVTGAICIINDT